MILFQGQQIFSLPIDVPTGNPYNISGIYIRKKVTQW